MMFGISRIGDDGWISFVPCGMCGEGGAAGNFDAGNIISFILFLVEELW